MVGGWGVGYQDIEEWGGVGTQGFGVLMKIYF